MNMCCLIKLHVDMLTLFKGLLTKEQMSIQKVRMKKKKKLHLACGNNHDGVVSILCMMLNLFLYFFFCFIDLKLYQLVWFFTIVQILCVNYMHKGQEETNVKTHYDSFGIDPMKMCLRHKTRMKVDHKI
jgi:hypothetical protein